MNGAISLLKYHFPRAKRPNSLSRFHIYTTIYLQYVQIKIFNLISHAYMLIIFQRKNSAIGEPTSQVITNWDTTKGTTLSQRGTTRDKSAWTEV